VNFALIGQNPIQSQSQSLVLYGFNKMHAYAFYGIQPVISEDSRTSLFRTQSQHT